MNDYKIDEYFILNIKFCTFVYNKNSETDINNKPVEYFFIGLDEVIN